ncbi:uncharacterized protein Z520_01677 [Fonsecaea multimorphosa CBS 102226]|uniref:Carbonic anhydrase n=1 Tax=Fonsecaea multimorphosa CBS 102226 TaxID=1442371 RepID=A0A0D2KIA3_9EURO|nr:uncharacterized protein Z520_01677 [Fonsecaea multimorphosa CBS 102226]KIY03210.1 hypothetical protein Z520_01677 [Fonsecaea multimorphosa CBS 102226]OAL30450.1 hypothetical protein AYO22_01648 [Fonsecaea multimorphosa]
MTTKLASFLESNAKFAENYVQPPPLLKMREMWARKGAKGTVILSCSDPRVIPERFMGLDFENPAAVIRNAGGRAMDAMRTLQVLNTITPLDLIIVVHHTDCGTTHVPDSEVRERIKQISSLPAEDIDAIEFGEITDLEASIREDVAMIKDDPLYGGNAPAVVGLLYEIETGRLRQVE